MNEKRDLMRTMVRGMYDMQKLRISIGNRIAQNYRRKLGLNSSDKETADKEANKVLKNLRADYKRITDGIVGNIPKKNKFKSMGVITDHAELILADRYEKQLEVEEDMAKGIGMFLKDFEIYNRFLSDVKGCGPLMSGVIISEIDITRAKYPSSLWKYSGLDVAQDGAGRSRKKEHLVDIDYIDKEGEEKTKKGITFNPFLKTKLTGVLGPSFLKSGGVYADIYYGYKNRLENEPAHAEKTKGHRHNMAIRYAVKQFLKDLYNAWRPIEGLPVAPDYAEGKLGIVHAA